MKSEAQHSSEYKNFDKELAFCSSSFSWKSWNASHHLPRTVPSFGQVIFHSWAPSCGSSL
jgi:hypothetical protein